MASQWRIRHKLMLGLGLVVGIMALLLGGTLRGLWSYYVTMNSIRSKLHELRAAGKYKAVVDRLSRPEPQRKPSAPDTDGDNSRTTPALEGDTTRDDRRFREMPGKVAKARTQLEEYEKQLEDTLAHGRDPSHGEHQLSLVKALHENLERLEKLLAREVEPVMGVQRGGLDLRKFDRAQVEAEIDSLERTTNDLLDGINRDLDQRIYESRNHYQVTLWISIPTSIVGLLLITGLLRSFYTWVFSPIRDLEAGVTRVAKGDFEHRIELHSGDEMEDLAEAFNDMMQRLHHLYSDLARQVNERSRQLVRSERLASVGFLAAGVAHEINNPLASIAFCSEALEARLTDLLRQVRETNPTSDDAEVFSRYLKMIQDEAFRCKNITERLLAFSRTSERRREPVDLRELVQSVLDVTQHLQNHRGKHIAFDVSADRGNDRILAWVNAEEIKSVVLNLVVNALDSMDDGGKLTIRLSRQNGQAELRFTDTGCGMTSEVLENIFEPFFTRSRTGKGTGLGLTISHRIIIQHGGDIEASSPGPNQGSTFVVRLPMQAPAENAEDRPAEARKAA